MNFNNPTFEMSAAKINQLPEPIGPEIAFAGRSNVGKSSLINRVFGRKKLARISATPGKTATVNFYKADDRVKLIDLPGYGYAKVGKTMKASFSNLIGGYLTADRDLRLVILLMDIRHEPSELDRSTAEFLIETEVPFLIAFTKADKLSLKAAEEKMESYAPLISSYDSIVKVLTSSEDGTGIEELRSIIEEVTAE